jgi:hypothetical protein
MPPAPKHTRRWYQFSLRMTLVVVAILALATCVVAWKFQDVFFHDFYVR